MKYFSLNDKAGIIYLIVNKCHEKNPNHQCVCQSLTIFLLLYTCFERELLRSLLSLCSAQLQANGSY